MSELHELARLIARAREKAAVKAYRMLIGRTVEMAQGCTEPCLTAPCGCAARAAQDVAAALTPSEVASLRADLAASEERVRVLTERTVLEAAAFDAASEDFDEGDAAWMMAVNAASSLRALTSP